VDEKTTPNFFVMIMLGVDAIVGATEQRATSTVVRRTVIREWAEPRELRTQQESPYS